MESQGSPSALKKPPPLYRGIYLDYLESLTPSNWSFWSRLREDLRGVAHNKVKTKR